MHIIQEGEITFWTVQRYASPWHIISDYQLAKIPSHLRYSSKGSNRSLREPFYQFSACGDIWQLTGNHGVKTFEEANKLLVLVVEYNPGEQFRAVEVKLSLRYLSSIEMHRKP